MSRLFLLVTLIFFLPLSLLHASGKTLENDGYLPVIVSQSNDKEFLSEFMLDNGKSFHSYAYTPSKEKIINVIAEAPYVDDKGRSLYLFFDGDFLFFAKNLVLVDPFNSSKVITTKILKTDIEKEYAGKVSNVGGGNKYHFHVTLMLENSFIIRLKYPNVPDLIEWHVWSGIYNNFLQGKEVILKASYNNNFNISLESPSSTVTHEYPNYFKQPTGQISSQYVYIQHDSFPPLPVDPNSVLTASEISPELQEWIDAHLWDNTNK